jgi:Flp pilus assembly protein TadD
MAGSPSVWGGDDFLALVRKAGSRQEPEERVEYFSRAIAAWTPGHGSGLLAACYFGRGEARFKTGDMAQALPDLVKAQDDDPNNARAVFLRGRILLHQTLLEEEPSARSAAQAAQVLAEYSALKPEDVEGLLAWGRAQVLAGRSDEARLTFGRARKLAPADPRPSLGTGRAFMAARRWDPAREDLEAADGLAHGRDADVLAERAACRLAQGDQAGALADLGRSLPLQEDILQDLTRSRALPLDIEERQSAAGRAYLGRGGLRESRGDTAGALADYEAGCRHGSRRCCARAAAMGPPSLKGSRPPLPEGTRPKKKPKRRQLPNPESDPGDRIYGS